MSSGPDRNTIDIPMPLTEFVGRHRERAELTALLTTHRLITVFGSGGAGKTRLALAVSGDRPERPLWVALAALESGDLVAPTVARALGIPEAGWASATDEICSILGDDEVLLVLDTCEHVADAVALLVEYLLVRCRGLTVLATSRRRLTVQGEMLWPLPPLGCTPPADADQPSDAVALFLDRAHTLGSDVRGAASLATVDAIARRLDGNPLAIELAAARTRMLSLREIYAALDDSLRLLVGRSHSAPPRQQTLRATLDWSHRLLTDAEAALFRRLAVFVGGADLEAIAAVTTHTPGAVLEQLAGLEEHSLLRVSLLTEPVRYELPDPVRQYAQERLDSAGETDECRVRHLAWFASRASAADALTAGQARPAAYGRLQHDVPNLHAALAWSDQSGQRQLQLTLAADLAPFAIDRGRYREGRTWLEAALATGDEIDTTTRTRTRTRTRAVYQAGLLAFLQCDYPTARSRLEAARSAYHRLGDDHGVACTVQALSGVVREQGNYAVADELAASSLAYWQSVGDDAGAAGARARRAFTALLDGRVEQARTLGSQTLVDARRLGEPALAGDALVILGGAALAARDLGAAAACFEEAHRWGADNQHQEVTAYAEEGLGLLRLARGEVDAAVPRLQSSLKRQHGLGDHWRSASLLVELATCRRLRDEPHEAARLLAAAEALLEQIGGQLPPVEHPERDRTAAFVTANLSKDDRDAASLSGRSADLATSLAAATRAWEPARNPAYRTPVVLTPIRGGAVTGEPVSSEGPSGGDRLRAVRSRPDPTQNLRLAALGQEGVQLDGRSLGPASFSYAKPRELLFFLAERGPVDKAQIGLALWPEASTGELRSAFHTTLHHLRKAVGAERVPFHQGRYDLDADGLDYDVHRFREGLAAARSAPERASEVRQLQRATQLYTGDFLPLATSEWSAAIRDALRDQFQRASMALGRLLCAGGGHTVAVDAFRRVLDSDPLFEAAHRELMRCFEALGEPARAGRQYGTLATRLGAELGVPPAPITTELYQRICAPALSA